MNYDKRDIVFMSDPFEPEDNTPMQDLDEMFELEQCMKKAVMVITGIHEDNITEDLKKWFRWLLNEAEYYLHYMDIGFNTAYEKLNDYIN